MADDDDGPCLELESGPGLRGELFPLVGETVIGGTVIAGVFIKSPQIAARHSLLLMRARDGSNVWHIADLGARRPTMVDGHQVTGIPRALTEGCRIILEGGEAVLKFHGRRPVVSGVEHRGRWVTFSAWSVDPPLSYAIAAGDVCTASFDQGVTSTSTRPLAEIAKAGKVNYLEEIAGVRWPDLLWRTSEQRASLDGRLLFAVAALAAASGDLRKSRITVSWSGLIVWHARPAPRQDVQLRALHVAHVVLVAAGCTRIGREIEVATLLHHRDALEGLPLEADVRAALARLIEGAIHAPKQLAGLIDSERRALGDVDAADVGGLVAHLFPSEHARHRRIVEEARLLGAAGMVRSTQSQ